MSSVSALEILLAASILIAALLAVSLLKKEKTEGERFFLFWSLAIVIVAVTAYLVVLTIDENLQSVTGGPVHWHADYEIYSCREDDLHEPLDLADPTGISNRIGSSDFHEHGDKRIHVEGTVKNLAQVSLGSFFATIGGRMTLEEFVLPTNEGPIRLQNGMLCSDGQPGALQVFVYQTDVENKAVNQKKLTNFPEYVLSPYATVPPGDCIIIEFGPIKERTDKICPFYQIAIQNGELHYGN